MAKPSIRGQEVDLRALNDQLARIPGYAQLIASTDKYSRSEAARQFARAHGVEIPGGVTIGDRGQVQDNDRGFGRAVLSHPEYMIPAVVGGGLAAGAFAGPTIGEAALGPQAAGAAYPGAGTFGAPAAASGAAGGATGGAASVVPTVAHVVAPAAKVAAPAAAHSLFGVGAETLFNGGSALFGNLFGAWMQGKAADKAAQAETNAARYAADVQSKAQAEALQFSREQSENAYQNNEVSRRGNYDMYAAGQRRLGTLGEMVGLGPREIPEYVGGVDPHYTGGGDGTVGGAASGPAPNFGDVQQRFNALFPGESLTPDMLAAKRPELEAMGFRLNPNAHGQITDLSFGNSGYSLDPIYGAGAGINKKQWIINGPGGGGAPRAAARPAYVSPTIPFLSSTSIAPALGTLGSY